MESSTEADIYNYCCVSGEFPSDVNRGEDTDKLSSSFSTVPFSFACLYTEHILPKYINKSYWWCGWACSFTKELYRAVHTVYSVSVCRLSLICVCAQRTEHPKIWDIFVPPIRGCAHVKVYLKSLNEAWSNGCWSCRHTSLTLFH